MSVTDVQGRARSRLLLCTLRGPVEQTAGLWFPISAGVEGKVMVSRSISCRDLRKSNQLVFPGLLARRENS